jgi:HlyD family secretion protein
MEIFRKQVSLDTKSRFRWTLALIAALGVAAIGMPLYFLMTLSNLSFQPSNQTNVTPTIPQAKLINRPIAALGRIQTKDKIISLSGPSILQTARVAQLLVQEGDEVRRGQVVAILDILNQQQTALDKTKLDVKVAQAQLNQVKAGTFKQSEIAAQKARIADLEAQFQGAVNIQKAKIDRLQAEFRNAQTEYSRNRSLYEQGAISAVNNDSKSLAVETLQAQVGEAKASLKQILSSFPNQIKEAKASLEKLKEVRPIDVRVAQTQLETARVSILEAQAKLDLAYVKSPIDGKILKINTFPGENISERGMVDMGNIEQMYVIAEVYETDISKIKVGQKATISSRALPQEFTGEVEKIGVQIGKSNVLNNDPALNIDSRVVEVKIRLNSANVPLAANFINLQVDVKIEPNIQKSAEQ